MSCEAYYKYAEQICEIIFNKLEEMDASASVLIQQAVKLSEQVESIRREVSATRFNLESYWQNDWDDDDEEDIDDMPNFPKHYINRWLDDNEFLGHCPHLRFKDLQDVSEHYQNNDNPPMFCPLLASRGALSKYYQIRPIAFMQYIQACYPDSRLKELLESLNYYNIELS